MRRRWLIVVLGVVCVAAALPALSAAEAGIGSYVAPGYSPLPPAHFAFRVELDIRRGTAIATAGVTRG
jgi:hypothetical protein